MKSARESSKSKKHTVLRPPVKEVLLMKRLGE